MDVPITTYDGTSVNRSYQTPAYMANFRPAYVQKLKEKAKQYSHRN